MVGPLQQTGGFGPAQSVPARGAVASSRFDALRVRFGIEAVSPEATITVDKRINPIQDIEWISPLGEGIAGPLDLTGSAGTFVSQATVPSSERWIVHTGSLEGSSASARLMVSIGGVEVRVSINDTNDKSTIGMCMQLEAGDQLGAGASGAGGDTARIATWSITSYKVR
jgi:hypothetical protein